MSLHQLVVPVSIGELIDKITILEIKRERIAEPAKLRNVCHELDLLSATQAHYGLGGPALQDLTEALRAVNRELWDIEDAIRVEERQQRFGARFIALARSVYIKNDLRAAVKQNINLLFNSQLCEEKSYGSLTPAVLGAGLPASTPCGAAESLVRAD